MFFTASKILAALVSPGNLMLIALCSGAALLPTRRRRLGAVLIGVTAVFGVLVATTPLPKLAVIALEDRFPVPAELPENVDGIVVLAGMINVLTTEARGRAALNNNVERVVVGAELAHRYPEATFVFTGGSGDLFRDDLSEARVVRPILAQLGLSPERIVYEDAARNTFENAERTAALVRPKAGEVWILVTSAYHMPRAVGCFRQVGWSVVPYPVDHRTDGDAAWFPPSFDFADGLGALERASHEWIGLLAYRLTGRTDTLFPGPDG